MQIDHRARDGIRLKLITAALTGTAGAVDDSGEPAYTDAEGQAAVAIAAADAVLAALEAEES